MDTELTPEELETLKEHFRAAGCAIKDIGDANFEIVGASDFPLRTHVSVTPYYIELGTFITAVGSGFMPNRLGKVHAFLNRSNLAAKLAKFTLEEDKLDPDVEGWFVMASFRMLRGVTGGEYGADAIKNLVTLFFHDIAELLLTKSGFEVRAMLLEKP